MSTPTWDEVWGLPTEGRFDDPTDEARFLGRMVTAIGVSFSDPDDLRLDYAADRMAELKADCGAVADDAFESGCSEITEKINRGDDIRRIRCEVTEGSPGSAFYRKAGAL